jgi:hypothetical protein
MKTPKRYGKILQEKGSPISTTATDIEKPKASDMPEILRKLKTVLKQKSKKGPQLIKPHIQKMTNYMRILIKTAKIFTFTKLYGKDAKELKMLQQNKRKMHLITSLPLK